MIALAHPLALLGLLAVPVVLWLHRRRRRAIPVEVPSLLFVEGEPERPAAPERFRLDVDALLAAAAAALLALAATAPRALAGLPGRTVRVVVDQGPAMGASDAGGGPARRAEEVVRGIEEALRPGDVLEVVQAAPPRLLETARRGTAAVRILVSDRIPAGADPTVHVVAVGTPVRTNVGILAVDVEDRDGERRVFVAVGNDRDVEARVRLLAGGEAVEVAVPARGVASVERRRPVAAAVDAAGVEEVRIDGDGGAVAADDRVVLDVRPVLAAFAPPETGLSGAHADAVRRALDAVAPGRWKEVPPDAAGITLFVSTGAGPAPRSGDALVLRLHPVPPGVAAARRQPGAPVRPPDPDLADDLDVTGVELWYDPAVVRGAPPWPLADVVRRDLGVVLREAAFWPDPLAGTPAPVDHPIWPLFVENLVAARRGRAGASGWGVAGTLDAYVTFPGHDTAAFDPAWIAAAPPDRRPRERPLLPWLASGAAACLLLLWVVPRGRRR